MGYDVWCHEPLVLKKDTTKQELRDRLIAMQYPDGSLATPELWEKPTYWTSAVPKPRIPEDYDTSQLVEMIFGGYWRLEEHETGFLLFQPDEDHLHNTDDAFDIFGQIEDLLKPGQTLDFRGEDDYKWRWEVSKEGKLRELDSETYYGDDINAPPAIDAVLKILWPDGEEIEWTGQTVYEIAETLRKHGFGPYAGKEPLEALADTEVSSD